LASISAVSALLSACRFLFFKRITLGQENAFRRAKGAFEFMRSTKFIAILLAAVPVFAQEEASKQDVSVQVIGSFVKSTWNNGVEQNAGNSGGVLATYRYFFNNHNGVEANYAYTNNTERYSGLGVNTHSNEVSAAYVFRMPLKHFTPFVLAGAGALIFDPNNFSGATTQTRAAFVYGAGADFSIRSHIFLRAEYRGLVYNSPTYGLSEFSGQDRITHRAEPSVGFGYRF
jgi:opacity protein-like surface antigen